MALFKKLTPEQKDQKEFKKALSDMPEQDLIQIEAFVHQVSVMSGYDYKAEEFVQGEFYAQSQSEQERYNHYHNPKDMFVMNMANQMEMGSYQIKNVAPDINLSDLPETGLEQ